MTQKEKLLQLVELTEAIKKGESDFIIVEKLNDIIEKMKDINPSLLSLEDKIERLEDKVDEPIFCELEIK